MKKVLLFITCISVILLIIISCEDEPTAQDTNPSVKIINPANNASVSDTTTIKISVNNIDVKRVELYIDHIFLDYNVFEHPPYEYLWDCRWYQEGSQHIIQAKAYDNSGKVFESDYTIINVYRFMPSNLKAELISDSVVTLTWVDNCKYETGFEIEQAIDDSNFIKIAQLDSNSTEYLVNGSYSLNTRYLFRVRAFQLKKFSGYSNIAQAVLKLLEPINLTAIITTDTSVVLNWNDNNSFETGYVISQRNSQGIYVPIKYLQENSTSTVINQTFYLNEYYYFSIHALREYYESPKAFFPTISLNFPAPTDLDFVHLSETSIKLNWKDNSSFEKGFIVYRSVKSGQPVEIGRVTSDITEYTDNQLDTSQTYSYNVRAYTTANISMPSNDVNILFSKAITVEKHISVPFGISESAVSNDFKLVAIGGYTSPNRVCVRIFNLSDGTLIRTFIGDSTDQIFERIAISPDNKYVAAIGNYYTLKIWDIDTGQLYKILQLGTTPNFIQYTADGDFLIVEVNMRLRFYDTNNWNSVTRIYFSDKAVYMAIDPNQSIIAIGFWNSNLKVYDFQTGVLEYEIPNTYRTTSVHFDASGENLYFHSFGEFKVWNISTQSITKTITNFIFPRKMHITSDGKLAVCSGQAYALALWDIDEGIKVGSYLDNTVIEEVKFNPDNDKLFTREFNSGYYLWNVVNHWIRATGN